MCVNMVFGFFIRSYRRIIGWIRYPWDHLISLLYFAGYGVRHHGFYTTGIPYVGTWNKGTIEIGSGFKMHNRIDGNPIGVYSRCTLIASDGARLRIGSNVGISQSAIIAYADVTIGNNVKLGGGVSIFTTDFHSLDPSLRMSDDDIANSSRSSVFIGDNVFVGAHSIILKGVTIGADSIVGAGSVVTKSIPDGQIWAGNPARFIRTLDY